MRILISESQFKKILLVETNTIVVPDDKLTRAKDLVNKLKSRGFTLSQASSMVGNMWIESGFNPSAESGNGAIGLMQWLNEPRKKALISFSKHLGSNWTDEETQLDFIKLELMDGYKLDNGKVIGKGGDYEVSQFNKAMEGDTIRKKAENFALKVERCGNCDGTIDNRKESAKKIYDYVVGTYKPKNVSNVTNKENKNSKIGKIVYPKKDDYINVREDMDRNSNRITKIYSPDKIGKVTQEKIDSDGNKWFKVLLDKKVDGYTSGWVRSDMII